MVDIRAGVETKTAIEDLSAKSFPRYGLDRVRVRVMGRVRVRIGLGVGFGLGL